MIYIFNNYQIDSENFTIEKNNEKIDIEPRVFDLIVYLIENKSKVVTRDELFENIWKSHNVIDATLNNHIKAARNALGDEGQSQNIIKTVHGRGYQFITEISDSLENSKPLYFKNFVLLVTFSLLLVIALLIYFNKVNTIDQYSEIDNKKKSIAVLAFLDLSPQHDQEYFSDGMSEEILNKLTQIPDLRVISRTSSFYFKDKEFTANEIGKQLNVSHILEGSVRKHGNKLRITVQLIETKTSKHIWSETYDKIMIDVFKIQDDIAGSVSKHLTLSIIPKSKITITTNPEAYSEYLRAKHLTLTGNLKDTMKAEISIKKSIALDSNYAPSWNLFGHIVFRSTHNYLIKPVKDGDKITKLAVEKAIELNPNYALSYATLARLQSHNKDFIAARKNIQKAIDLNSKNSYVISVAISILEYSGNLEKSLEMSEIHKDINPKYFANYLYIGDINFILNNQDSAYKAYIEFVKHFPNAEIIQYKLSIVSLAMGRYDQALMHAKKEKSTFWRLYAMNLALYAVGETQEANLLFKKFIDDGGELELGHIARIYAFRGNIDKSFESLVRAFDNNDSSLIEILNLPSFWKMHNDPRWHKLIRQMKFPASHWLVKKLP